MGFKARPIKFRRNVTAVSRNDDGTLTLTLECRHLLRWDKDPCVVVPTTYECQACTGQEARIQDLTIELRRTSEYLHEATARIDRLLTRGA